MTDARTDILERIRAANGGPASLVEAEADRAAVPRAYRVSGNTDRKQVVELLCGRLVDYDATVTKSTPVQLVTMLARTFKAAGVRRIGVSGDFDQGKLPEDFDYVADNNLTPMELDRLDAVLSRCSLAIAETGTLVLQADKTQGRRALTLVPDTHVCLVMESQVVATVPEAFAWLQATATLPTTFVSGPSATADIEMTRIKGVHGPRFLHVILVDDMDGNRVEEGAVAIFEADR